MVGMDVVNVGETRGRMYNFPISQIHVISVDCTDVGTAKCSVKLLKRFTKKCKVIEVAVSLFGPYPVYIDCRVDIRQGCGWLRLM